MSEKVEFGKGGGNIPDMFGDAVFHRGNGSMPNIPPLDEAGQKIFDRNKPGGSVHDWETQLVAEIALSKNSDPQSLLRVISAIPDAEVDKPIPIVLSGETRTPALHLAAAAGRGDAVELLLKKGAKHDALDSAGRTALECAEQSDNKGVADILAKFKKEKTPSSGVAGGSGESLSEVKQKMHSYP